MESKNLTIIMYHYVRDLKNSRCPGIKGLDVSLFKEQIAYLKRYYHFVTIQQIIDAFYGYEKLPSKSVLLTFDDAYIDHFTTVFPILEREKIQGAFYPPVKAITEHSVLDVNKIHFILASTPLDSFGDLLFSIETLLGKYREEYHLNSYDYYFNKLAVANRFDCKEIIFVKRLLQVELDEKLRRIITDILFKQTIGIDEGAFSRELYMNRDQIKCMVDCGMHVGCHGYDHYWLSSLTKEKQKQEISQALAFIKEIGENENNWTMCYPYGDYNEDTISLLKENGCKLGLTTKVGLALINGEYVNQPDAIYKLPRLDTNDIPKNSLSNPNDWYKLSI